MSSGCNSQFSICCESAFLGSLHFRDPAISAQSLSPSFFLPPVSSSLSRASDKAMKASAFGIKAQATLHSLPHNHIIRRDILRLSDSNPDIHFRSIQRCRYLEYYIIGGQLRVERSSELDGVFHSGFGRFRNVSLEFEWEIYIACGAVSDICQFGYGLFASVPTTIIAEMRLSR